VKIGDLSLAETIGRIPQPVLTTRYQMIKMISRLPLPMI